MIHRANKILISKSEALQMMAIHTPEILVFEVVSDYYQESAYQQYRHAHPVPGFAQIKTEQLEIGPLWNLRPDAQLEQVLTEYGLVPESSQQILLFDNIQLECGQIKTRFDASARLFSILHYFGFSNVAIILDPAIHPAFPDEFVVQHQQIVRRLTSKLLSSRARLSQDGSLSRGNWVPKHSDHFINYMTMVSLLAGKLGPYRLLDARSAEEYAGIYTGYDYIPLAGKIPTAESIINGDYQVSATENMATVLARLAATLEHKGIGHADRIVWYCGTGWRASRMCALTQALGYSNVALYDGGWNEWQQRHPQDGTERPWGIEPLDSPV
jgi:molybdopterin synthase sulfurtransferase